MEYSDFVIFKSQRFETRKPTELHLLHRYFRWSNLQYEIWSLTLREEQRLRVFENRELARIFRLNTDKVAVGQRKCHNVELHNLYSFGKCY